MSNALGGITNIDIRDSIGDRCFIQAGTVIDETNTENVKIVAAVEHTINGVFQTPYAVAAEIDLSDLEVISAKDGSILSVAGAGLSAGGTVAIPAKDSGDDEVTKYWILACAGDEAFIIEPEVDVAAAQDNADYEFSCPPGYAPFGIIKVVCSPAAGAVATFVLGTTALTGVTRQTVTFFDVANLPPTAAKLIEL